MCVAAAALAPSAGTLGNAALGLQIAGGLFGAKSSYDKSKADRAGLEYQEGVARYNAELDELRARDAISRGQIAENNQRLKTAQVKGSQEARFAARGVDFHDPEGSAWHILADTDYIGGLDADTIKDNAAREAWALREQARSGVRNADMLAWRAGQESPGKAAFSSLLSSAGTIASTWYRLKGGTA